jgi:putative acetyltransferase
MALVVRCERPTDEAAISEAVEAAFGDSTVAELTESIRSSSGYVRDLTFVGEEDSEIVGFTMLSYLEIESLERRILVLTPMAVRPDRQRRGIGAAIVRTAVAAADEAYYPRFGFVSATGIGLEPPGEQVPDEAWLALPLRACDPEIRGRVVYPSFFPPPPNA